MTGNRGCHAADQRDVEGNSAQEQEKQRRPTRPEVLAYQVRWEAIGAYQRRTGRARTDRRRRPLADQGGRAAPQGIRRCSSGLGAGSEGGVALKDTISWPLFRSGRRDHLDKMACCSRATGEEFPGTRRRRCSHMGHVNSDAARQAHHPASCASNPRSLRTRDMSTVSFDTSIPRGPVVFAVPTR